LAPPPLYVAPPLVESMEEATVDCLINTGSRSWNSEMVDGIFVPSEARKKKKNTRLVLL